MSPAQTLAGEARPHHETGVDVAFEQRPGDELWMLDQHGSTALPCRCIESSAHGMRLAVPPGYGLAVGQEYELRPHHGCIPLATAWIGRARVRIAQIRWAADLAARLQVEALRLPPEGCAPEMPSAELAPAAAAPPPGPARNPPSISPLRPRTRSRPAARS